MLRDSRLRGQRLVPVPRSYYLAIYPPSFALHYSLAPEPVQPKSNIPSSHVLFNTLLNPNEYGLHRLCFQCFKEYSDHNGVKRHFKISHLEERKCNFCNLAVLHEMHLRLHAEQIDCLCT